MPKTAGWVDPQGPAQYHGYARAESHAAIVDKICAEFSLPVIVKRNSGSQGQHVFLCKSRAEAAAAVAAVFDPEPRGYDHVVLAQEYIEPRKEYRAIVFRKEVLLAYEKRQPEPPALGGFQGGAREGRCLDRPFARIHRAHI
jgi:biotin carboxylase